jgi:hypothetical protein
VPVVPGTIKIVFSINFLHFILAQTLLKNSGKFSKKYFLPRKAGTKPKVLNKTEQLKPNSNHDFWFKLAISNHLFRTNVALSCLQPIC